MENGSNTTLERIESLLKAELSLTLRLYEQSKAQKQALKENLNGKAVTEATEAIALLLEEMMEEVAAGIAILKACGLRRSGVRFVSCPTCGRTSIDLIGLAEAAEKRLSGLDRDITVAVMGCEVNGPGEAAHADYGVAGGKGFGSLFVKGRVVKTRIPEERLLDELMELIRRDEG